MQLKFRKIWMQDGFYQVCDNSGLMMFEGKHIHFSPIDKKPLCSYSAKLCKQRRINGYAFCIRHILEDKSAPFKQCAHVARYNKQKCTNPIPSNENREFCNSHMQVAGMLPKKERKNKKEKEKELFIPCDGKLKFADRLRALLKKENSISCNDDPFISDDPYAFPDPISEQENGCIGFSPTPIIRTTWGCSQKVCSDSASSDSPSRGEQPVKNSISSDGKLKSNTPKLSKTMNRLHAKIAQNKILDKQKKTQDSSQSTIALTNINFTPVTVIKTEPLSPVEGTCLSNESNDIKLSTNVIKTEPVKLESHIHDAHMERTVSSNSVDLPSSPLPCLDSPSLRLNSRMSSESVVNHDRSPSTDSSTKEQTQLCNIKVELPDENIAKCRKVPHVLHKMHRIFKTKKKRNRDLVPLGFESSETESSDSEEESHLFSQLSWFCAWDRRSSSTIQNAKSSSRQIRQMQLKSELQRSYQQLCRLHTLHKQEFDSQKDLIQPLIDAARNYPNEAAEILMNHTKSFSKKKTDKLIQIEKKNCCYKQDDTVCNLPALPYTWHCQKHIMYNVDQLLFQHCTAKYPDNTQCCVPVFDISHELPLCAEHAKKRDNYHKLALEPKPKKPRKKPKPSALTRPPKRGKKKKKPNLLRPASPLPPLPTSPSAPNSSSNTKIQVSSQVSLGPEILKSVETAVSTAVIARDLNGQMDSELGSDMEEQFSPGAIEKSLELPLDTAELANQATKLLEEHDFTEVLNKIPDDAFNDLFVDTRNGEYIPSREETEELERALAAVSKDVHLAKVSLAKLSSGTGPDLEELERSIEIHGSLLGADNLTSAIDENTFPELTNVITSSFSTSDFNSLSQALSSIAAENIDQNHLPTVSDSHLIQNSVTTVPLLTSDVPHPHVLNGHTFTGVHPLHVDHNFAPHLLDNMNPNSASDAPADSRILGNNHFAAILFGLGQASASSLPQTTYASSSNISEDTGLMSASGGLTSTHWLLNASDQVLALSHMAYQNGFIVTSQGATPYTGPPLLGSVGKYPLQTLSAEVSLVSSNSPLVTSSCSDSVICGTAEQPVPSISLSSRPSLQQNNSTTVIAQEGAS